MASVFQEPTGKDVTVGSYESPDETVDLRGDGKLHVLMRSSKRFQLTLINDSHLLGSSGLSLNCVNLEQMEQAVKLRVLYVNGMTLRLANVRRLTRMLVKIRKNRQN